MSSVSQGEVELETVGGSNESAGEGQTSPCIESCPLQRNVSELNPSQVDFHLPTKLCRLEFPRVTDQDEEVAKAIKKRFERKYHRSPSSLNPAEAFKLLKVSEATRLLSWEAQVASCTEGESDDFWIRVSVSETE